MGDKKHKNAQMGIGEINTIRDILLGDKFEKIEMQMKMLQHDMNEMRTDVASVLKDMKVTIKQNRKHLKEEMLQKIVDLENRMIKGQDKAISRMTRDKIDHEENLAKIFSRIGKEIKSSK